MTMFHCLACDDLRVLSEGEGEGRCGCGLSTADLAHDTVILHGPCRVVWIDDTQVVATVVGSPEWPGIAPHVVRKPVPPLV